MVSKSIDTTFHVGLEDIKKILADYLEIPVGELKFNPKMTAVSDPMDRYSRYEFTGIDVTHSKKS